MQRFLTDFEQIKETEIIARILLPQAHNKHAYIVGGI